MILIIVTDKIVIIIMISIKILMNTSGFLSIYYEPEEGAALILMKYPLTLYKTQPLLAPTQPTWTDVSTCSLFPALLSLVVPTWCRDLARVAWSLGSPQDVLHDPASSPSALYRGRQRKEFA